MRTLKKILKRMARYQLRYWITGIIVAFLAGLGMEKSRMAYHFVSQFISVIQRMLF